MAGLKPSQRASAHGFAQLVGREQRQPERAPDLGGPARSLQGEQRLGPGELREIAMAVRGIEGADDDFVHGARFP